MDHLHALTCNLWDGNITDLFHIRLRDAFLERILDLDQFDLGQFDLGQFDLGQCCLATLFWST